jgi:hypothetical protein
MRSSIVESSKAFLIAATLVGGFSTSAMAASDGTLDATSQGSVEISASVPNRVRLTGLDDVAFTNQDPSTAASNAQDVCVWSNTGGGYSITATGSGAANAFTLANGSLTVPYSVAWNSSAGQTTGTALTTATPLASLTSAATNQLCASGPSSSASLIVGISSDDLQTMQGGLSYTGTLTLLVTPD